MSGGVDQRIETYVLYGGTSPHAKMNRLKEIDFDMDGDSSMDDEGDYTLVLDYDDNGNMSSKDITYPNGGGTNEAWDYYYDADDRLGKSWVRS